MSEIGFSIVFEKQRFGRSDISALDLFARHSPSRMVVGGELILCH